MKIGTVDIEKIYLGTNEIPAIYLGDTSIYSGGGDQPEGILYAYSNGNDTIYTTDEVLQGTYKGLNTNDFTDDGVSIDSDGIATFSDNTSSTNLKLTAKTALFGTGINNYYKIHVRMSQTSFSQWTSFFNFSPYTENYNAFIGTGSVQNYGARFMFGTSSGWSSEFWVSAYGTLNTFVEAEWIREGSTMSYGVVGSTYTTNNSISISSVFNGAVPCFGWYGYKLDLTKTYIESLGKKTTLAIWDTTSTVYDSSWNELSGAEHYNDVIKVNGTVYTRNPLKDIVPLPAKLYAYANGNDVIYAGAENIEGTFKALNTNDFTNTGVSIDNNGIAVFSDSTSDPDYSIKTNEAIFGTGVNNNWKYHITLAQTKFISWAPFFWNEVGTDYKNCNVGRWSNQGFQGQRATARALPGKGSSWGSEIMIPMDYLDDYSTVELIQDGTDLKYKGFGQSDYTTISNTSVDFNGSIYEFGSHGFKLDLINTWLESQGNKYTLAILNTKTPIYNSSFKQVFGSESYNNVIKYNNVVYTRDPSKDII